MNLRVFRHLFGSPIVPDQSCSHRGNEADQRPFRWPQGKGAALSLTFDDARPSQIDRGLTIFEDCGVRVTFFVSPDKVESHIAGWRNAVAAGHEIGNHSLTHPCTGNYTYSLHNALEDYTLEMIAKDIDDASGVIELLLGLRPVTFAYPCGQKFVGRGRGLKSYVPLVDERFIVGRGYLDEAANDPAFCDLAQVTAMALDDLDYKQIWKLISEASAEQRWLILVGHDIGKRGYQRTDASALLALCRYARDPSSGLWLDTVETIGKYIHQERTGWPPGSGRLLP